MAKNSQEYWNERARQDKIKVIKTAEYGVDNLKKLLKKNLDSVEKQIKEFYKKYGDEGKYAESLSYAEFQKYKAKLRLKAKQNPQDKTLQRLAKQDIPKYRIDRLRALQTDLQIQLTEATRGQEAGIYKTLKDVAKVSQATTALRFKKTLDVAFDKIASRKLEKILSSDWVGNMNWSERLWKDRELVGKKVTEILEEGIPQGKSMQSMARELKGATQSSFNDAFRLIRTESAHVDGEVLLESFKQAQRCSYEELLGKIENGEYHIPHQVTLSIEAISFLNGMLQYNPNRRLDVAELSKQYFLTRDVKSFHKINLKRANKDMDLGESIILNAKKQDNSNIGDIWSQFSDKNLNEIDPLQNQDEKPFAEIEKEIIYF